MGRQLYRGKKSASVLHVPLEYSAGNRKWIFESDCEYVSPRLLVSLSNRVPIDSWSDWLRCGDTGGLAHLLDGSQSDYLYTLMIFRGEHKMGEDLLSDWL